MTSIGSSEREALDRDGFPLMRAAFSPQRITELKEGVESLVARAQRGECDIPWIDEAAGIPNRISHMMHPGKYEPAFGAWVDEDLVPDLEALMDGPVRHSLFGMLASGGGQGYRLPWHRDIGKPGADDEEAFLRKHHGHSIQFNAPVAGVDTFLHVVPGSHLRPSTAEEIAAHEAGVDGEIPAGIEVRLEPGDILYYNANLWHRGWNPEGRLRWTLHAAYWKAEYPVMTHEHGQAELLGTPEHLARLPGRARQVVQRYLDACTDAPVSLQEL